jgi:signal peptidase I
MKKINSIWKNKYIRFGIVATLYFLWVIWLGGFWWLLLLPVIFDIYITQKVRWAFWKPKKDKKYNFLHKKALEWTDAIIFAVIAASFIRLFFFEAFTIPTASMEKSMLRGDYLFVSKTAYGPRKPMTPLSFPFVHHTMPLSKTKKSYSTAIQKPYERMKGFGIIKRDDVVVFNFPTGDTVCLEQQNRDYYDMIREEAKRIEMMDVNMNREVKSEKDYYIQARKKVRNAYTIIDRPIDKRENYIKRCVGIPGDTLEIKDGYLFVNGKEQKRYQGIQYNYEIITDGTSLNSEMLDRMDIDDEDKYQQGRAYILPLIYENFSSFKKVHFVNSITRLTRPDGVRNYRVFPHHPNYNWNEDWFGPLYVPQKGVTIPLTVNNLPLYERIIGYYEENELKVNGNEIFINGEKTDSYTFKMNYYWLMGDNRHNSLDSRFWGFVPENHVVGKAAFIWLSLDKSKSFPQSVRWNRLFSKVR